MDLLPLELRKQIPALYSQEHVADPIIVCRYFVIGTYWAWYVIEGEPFVLDNGKWDYRFFGLVSGHEVELGYFVLSELQGIAYPFAIAVERDLHFKPCHLSEVRAQLGAVSEV